MSSDDVFVWPCGTWCFRDELPDYDYMSDDCVCFVSGTPEWAAVTI